VAWAEVAHAAGFGGCAWMSKRCNTDRAYVLFGDRVGRDDVEDSLDYLGFSRPRTVCFG
jgi:hypothetical protein